MFPSGPENNDNEQAPWRALITERSNIRKKLKFHLCFNIRNINIKLIQYLMFALGMVLSIPSAVDQPLSIFFFPRKPLRFI